jgi:hypothetical protein
VAKKTQDTRVPARFVEPMQCLAVAKLPEGPDWEYEIKFDGYRALGTKSAGRVRLMSRNGNDFSAQFPSVAKALSKLPDDSIIDGEIVALDKTGRTFFNVLQNYNHADTPLQFYAFDLLHLAGKNLRDRPLDERRALLRAKVMPRMSQEISLSDTLDAPTAEIVAAVKKQGLEGVIAKRRDSSLRAGPALGRVGENAHQQGTGACDRRLRPGAKKLRLDHRRLLRARRSYLRCARPGRFRPGASGEGFRAIPQAGNQDLPLFEPAAARQGQMGSGSDGRQDGRMPLAEAAACRADRVRGLDRREPPTPLEIHRPA